MQIKIEDILFWMDAIRQSDDCYRTLESFWKGQIRSKIWLIENLKKYCNNTPQNIVIYGGWYGVLSSLIFNSDINVNKIISVDIDPGCKDIATLMNKNYEIEGRFEAVTADMAVCNYAADIVINTSCEHIKQDTYNTWLNLISSSSLIVLQSNNFFSLEEHIRCSKSLNEFDKISNISTLLKDELETEKYTRYMIIGKKNVF